VVGNSKMSSVRTCYYRYVVDVDARVHLENRQRSQAKN